MTTLIDSTDGVKVAVHDFGGSGPPLLIVHATGFHGHCYEPVARRINDHFHVMAPDLRGHGDSVTPPGTSMNWWDLAADLSSVIKHLDTDTPVAAVGHSMGGSMIMMTEILQPATISHAWLFEPIVIPENFDTAPNPMSANALRRKQRFESRDEVLDRYSSRPPFSGIDPEALRAYIDYGFADEPGGGVVLKCSGEIEAQVFENTARGLMPRLAEVSSRLTIVGSGDGGMPAQIAPLITEALPHATFVKWPDSTHFGPFEKPAESARQILAALT